VAEIRAARRDDLGLLAEVMDLAARAHLPRGPWDWVFPEEAERLRALRLLADGPPSWCHHGVFHVAECEGQGAAALCAFEPAALGGSDLPLAEVFEGLGFSAARLASVASPLGTYMECFPDMPEDTWIVEQVGTRPAFRRRGLVAALLEHALGEGRRRGVARAQISVLIGNDPARRAYEQAGFRVAEERKSAAFEALLGSPGFLRMTRSLED
jgi:translation initiation factor 4G